MTPQYRKLPGKRRGFLNVSSVWAGPDHLLLVRGSRFREEYKRFYYRDVQAIAVARAPRFHISPRSAAIAVASWVAFLLAQVLRPYQIALLPPRLNVSLVSSLVTGGIGLLCLVLLLAWIYVSAKESCRCRIYTAVSSDELPSVYRLWTAREFLTAVEQPIAQTQGTIEGEWAMAAEERTVGPAPPVATPVPVPYGTPETRPANVPRRGLVSDLFLLSLAADALTKSVALPAALRIWLPFLMELATVVGAVAVIVQHNRGRIRAGMHRVAVASLLAFGVLYYVQSMSAGMSATLTAAKTGKRTIATTFPQSPLAQQVGAGIDAILVIVGLIVALRQDEESRRGILG